MVDRLKCYKLHIQIESEKLYIKNCYFKSVFINIAAANQMLKIISRHIVHCTLNTHTHHSKSRS